RRSARADRRARPRPGAQHATADARRRVPAADRRSARRGRLTRQREEIDMTAIAPTLPLPQRRSVLAGLAPLATLARRRIQLTARTPRELVVPLLTPVMFALVIAPALKQALHTDGHYESYVALGTVGLLIPLNTMFAGLGVIVDREHGAQRELLAAPVPRALLVLGNLLVALAV